MEMDKGKIHTGNIVIYAYQFVYQDINITWSSYNWKRMPIIPKNNLNVTPIKESTSNIDNNHKEDPRPHNVQRSRNTYTCVGETRGSGNLFLPNYKFNLVKIHSKTNWKKDGSRWIVKIVISEFVSYVHFWRS